MIYAGTKQEIETKRKAFIRKWRLKCKAVADSLEEAGDKLFTFTRFPKNQWKSIRTSNAIRSTCGAPRLSLHRRRLRHCRDHAPVR
jgi:putative transposase